MASSSLTSQSDNSPNRPTIESELAETNAALATAQGDISSLQTIVGEHENAVNSLQALTDVHTGQIASLTSDVDTATSTNDTQDDRLDNLELVPMFKSITQSADEVMSTASGVDPTILEALDIKTWFGSQERRSTTKELAAGERYYGNRGMQKAIVGDQYLCGQPATDPGWYWPAHNAIFGSKYSNLRIIPTASLSLTGAFNSGTLQVASIPRDLPKGAVLAFKHNSTVNPVYYVQLTANVSMTGDPATIPVRTIFSDVAITTSFTGYWGSRYASQKSPNVSIAENVMVCADPDTWFAYNRAYIDPSLKYATDGISFNGSGHKGHFLGAFGIPGVGIRLSHAGSEATSTGTQGPWDGVWSFWDQIHANTCLTGIVVQGGDEKFGNLYASNCRDFGIVFNGTANHGNSAHGWGANMAVAILGSINFASVDAADSNFGLDLHSWLGINSGAETQIGNLKVYNNIYSGFRCSQDRVHINNAIIEANSNGTTTEDPVGTFGGTASLTNYGMVLGSWADYFSCPALTMFCTNTANGLNLGHNAGKTLTAGNITGSIVKLSGAGTTYGCRIRNSIAGYNLNLLTTGFTTDFYVDTGASILGSRIILRGLSTSTIRWADGTTGTFASPNIPTTISNNNLVSILPF